MTNSNPSYDIHELYREFHFRCARRRTRSKETFDKQFDMLKNDQATLFGLKYKGEFIGFTYYLHFHKTCVYYSAADDPKYEQSKIPIYHSLLYSALEYYKKRDFEFMQLSQPSGYNMINAFDDFMDQKQQNIAHFKRGMGADMQTLFRGKRYFDKNLWLKDVEKLVKKIEKTNFI